MSDEDSISAAVQAVSKHIGDGGLNFLINDAAINKPASPAPLSATGTFFFFWWIHKHTHRCRYVVCTLYHLTISLTVKESTHTHVWYGHSSNIDNTTEVILIIYTFASIMHNCISMYTVHGPPYFKSP